LLTVNQFRRQRRRNRLASLDPEIRPGAIGASLPSLRGDTYYVIYDNRFDPFRDKYVHRRIDLKYQQ
jgi:hypothetical protein